MKKLLFLALFFCLSACCLAVPVEMYFTNYPSSYVYYGDTQKITVKMRWYVVPKTKRWTGGWELPSGSTIEYIGGNCMSLMAPEAIIYNYTYTCYLNIKVSGDSYKTVNGNLKYYIWTDYVNPPSSFYSPGFMVKVIPHPLSMSTIPIQQATANTPFYYNLKSAVIYYDENAKAGHPAQGVVTPSEQDGLRFDPATFSIVGTPNRSGTYTFSVGAKNGYSSAAPTTLIMHVNVNPADKPVFKKELVLPSAVPGEWYKLNLFDLIESRPGFGVTNQVQFKIDSNWSHPDWLAISNEDKLFLEGAVPVDSAGSEQEVTVVASSNTGGDSEPLTLRIPVASDPAKKPSLNYFELKHAVGGVFYDDLSTHIKDPGNTNNIQLILDKTEPKVSWIKVSHDYPLSLESDIPLGIEGQIINVTLRVSTVIGGSSEPVTIPLKIGINGHLTPRFSGSPQLILYPGQPFAHDFVENNEIYPAFNDFPYSVEFAEDYEPPFWLTLKDNKLSIDEVPDGIKSFPITVTIKNKPGGKSKPIHLYLLVMN